VSEDLNQYLPRWDQASSSAVGQKVKTVWGVGFVLEETYEVYGVAFKDGEGRIVREINKRELEEINSDRDIFSARLFFGITLISPSKCKPVTQRKPCMNASRKTSATNGGKNDGSKRSILVEGF
jgi:hypothetical protein